MKRKANFTLLVIFLFLMALGTVFVFTSSWYLAYVNQKPIYYFLLKHLLKVGLALVVFFLGFSIPPETLGKYRNHLMALSIILLIAVLVLPSPIAPKIGGARRWLNLMVMKFQVSELFKLATIIFLSFNARNMKETDKFLTYMLVVFAGVGLILIEPNVSTAFLISLIAIGTAFYAGASISILTTMGALAASALALAISIFPHARSRLLSDGIHYQVQQSLAGLTHGGLLGVGLGKGVEKFLYLPDAHTDFIFSIIGEELGFVGASMVIVAVLIIIFTGFKIAARLYKKDIVLSTLAFAITLNFAIYSLGHISVVVGLFPPTGIPMPFISYGGSNLLVNSFMMGILLNLSREAP